MIDRQIPTASDPISDFHSWLATATDGAPRTPNGIPLIGYDQLDLQDASAAPLISALADIIEATCVRAAPVVPMTHAAAA
jgi:hypothetical protein